MVTWDDHDYPKLLRELPDQPYILYTKGTIPPVDFWGIAVVGARKSTEYGREVTRELVQGLVDAGIPIVSGLALGIDSVAHTVCVNAQGVTVAVFACGLDRVYPTTHTNLAQQILDHQGAIISEYPPGVPALPHHFPIRNRIIAGLSKGVVVVEATIQSGSLLTAQAAVEYNREVFVVPHPIYSASGQGPLNLLKMGAKLVTGVQDILDELHIDKTRSTVDTPSRARPSTPAETIVLEGLKEGGRHIDELAEHLDLSFTQLSATITLMEMKGLIMHLGGNVYQRKV